jgi:hypothetical protein
MKKPPIDVETYLAKLTPLQRITVQRIRNAVLRAKPSLTQSLNPWGYLTFSAPDHVGAFTLVPHRRHVNLQIANGSRVAAKLPDIQGTGKNLRHIKFGYDEPVDVALVRKAVRLSLAVKTLRS